MGKGKGKGRGKNKPDKPDLAPQSAPYLSRTQRPAPHATIALTTYEILEAILLRVDEQTLLVSAQRVSTLWHRVMSTSVRLQRRLFFRSSPLPPPPPPGTTATITRNFNTFLKRTFPCLLPERNYCHWMLLPPFLRPPTTATTTDVTTMHNQLRLAPFRMAGYPSASSCWRPAILDARYAGTRRRAFARAGASWRRMLPADLAVRRVAVTSAVPGGGGVQEVVRVVEIVPGEEMTMGEYYDVVCDVNFRRRDGSGEWGEVQGVKGSWVAWRWKVVVAREGVDAADDGEGAGVVAGADLVIGELGSEVWWRRRLYESPGCVHWGMPKAKFYLLRPERGKSLYRSHYGARDRLWLGPPRAKRPESEEGSGHEDGIKENWEDGEEDSEPK